MGMKSLDGVVSSIFICVYVLSLGMYMHTRVLVCKLDVDVGCLFSIDL